jgi:hypothetical protein
MACPSLFDSAALLIPGLGYFAIALTTDINLGYRHILPSLAFLIIFSLAAVASHGRHHEPRPRTVAQIVPVFLLSAWLLLANLLIYPDYLAYFNLLAGGADNGWRSLVDSNLDWGQDIDDLAPWMAENGVDKVWLSYFGEARPEYYGINYIGLDSFPPRLMNPDARPYYDANPAPGVYAISATNLQGVHFANHDRFAWFRSREPLAKLGHSIFLYEVPPAGEPVDLLLAGLQVDQLPAALYDRLGTNDVRLHWMDPAQSLILPAANHGWLAVPIDQAIHPLLEPFLDRSLEEMNRDDGFVLASYNAPLLLEGALARFSSIDGQARLLNVEIEEGEESTLELLTSWEQEGPPGPVQIFVHALDEQGRIIAQWDGLGAAWEGWLEGDTLLQVHKLSWPEETPPAKLGIGLYNPQTGARWQTESGADYFEIPEFKTPGVID